MNIRRMEVFDRRRSTNLLRTLEQVALDLSPFEFHVQKVQYKVSKLLFYSFHVFVGRKNRV